MLFFFNDTATTEIYTLSLHDALPICPPSAPVSDPYRTSISRSRRARASTQRDRRASPSGRNRQPAARLEEHTSELQSRQYLVCRLLLVKKKTRPKKLSQESSDIHKPT